MKEISANKNCDREKDDQNPGSSNLRNEHLNKKHASNIENNRDTIQDNRFPTSDMDELRQPSTPSGVANETLEETIVLNQNRQEADYHIMLSQCCELSLTRSNNRHSVNCETLNDHFAAVREQPLSSTISDNNPNISNFDLVPFQPASLEH